MMTKKHAKWYKDCFDAFKADCSDNENQTVVMRTMEDDIIPFP